MYEIQFDSPCHIHLIGIGGISMSGLAEVLLKAGFRISGSDVKESELTRKLTAKGAIIYYQQVPENLKVRPDVIVYTAAIHPDNPEYAKAAELGIPMLSRAELLGQMMRNYRTPVAVAGTHGKTTTTSMLAHIFLEADLDPTISVGGILPAIGGNVRVGGEALFLMEACEYTNSFLSFFPKVGIILNVDADHLDFFKDIDDIRASFRKFAQRIPKDGCLILNADTPSYERIAEGLDAKVLTYSTDPARSADYTIRDMAFDEQGRASFTAVRGGKELGSFRLQVPGEHNVSNALAAIACADHLQIDPEKTAEGLASFTGTDRRFQYKGNIGGVTVIDDYAHHPTEITATLKAAAAYPHKTLWCVFQPHTYTRTKALMPEFADALTLADKVILAEIYPARETDDLGISSSDLAQEILDRGTEAVCFPTFDEIETYILKNCAAGDLLITMGAGDVVKIGEALLGL